MVLGWFLAVGKPPDCIATPLSEIRLKARNSDGAPISSQVNSKSKTFKADREDGTGQKDESGECKPVHRKDKPSAQGLQT